MKHRHSKNRRLISLYREVTSSTKAEQQQDGQNVTAQSPDRKSKRIARRAIIRACEESQTDESSRDSDPVTIKEEQPEEYHNEYTDEEGQLDETSGSWDLDIVKQEPDEDNHVEYFDEEWQSNDFSQASDSVTIKEEQPDEEIKYYAILEYH